MASSGATTPVPSTSTISETAFQAALGVMFVVALALAGARTRVRYHRFHALFIDDVLLFLGVACLIAGVGMLYSNLPFLYEEFDVSVDLAALTPAFVAALPANQKIQNAAVILLNITIWCVKFVFLFFFRNLIRNVRSLEIWWWCVFVILVLSIPIGVFFVLVACPYTTFDGILTNCVSSLAAARIRKVEIAQVVMDVATDILIVSIPIALLWKARLSLGQKLAIGSLLCLSVFAIAINVAALAISNASNPWAFFWIPMEACVAVIVASLSVCRTLFRFRRSNRPGPRSERQDRNVGKIPRIALPILPSIRFGSLRYSTQQTQGLSQSHLPRSETTISHEKPASTNESDRTRINNSISTDSGTTDNDKTKGSYESFV